VALAIEAGRNAVVHALAVYPWFTVYPVHPATSERFRKAFTPWGARSDLPDAEVLPTILDQHRSQLRAMNMNTPQTRDLAALTEIRRCAVDHRTQLTNELRSTLKLYFLQALELCGEDLWTDIVMDFLERWPELALLQRVRPATFQSFYTAHNSRRQTVISGRIALICEARPSHSSTLSSSRRSCMCGCSPVCCAHRGLAQSGQSVPSASACARNATFSKTLGILSEPTVNATKGSPL
jgi:hypothetical protein